MSIYSISELQSRLQKYPKKPLIHLPTPFKKLENLSRALEGPEIFIKREDLTGLCFGGNKSRKLEYIMFDALQKGANAIITWASVQSNWCLQTAAAAKMCGIKPILMLYRTYMVPEEFDGNLLLDFILDAEIQIRDVEPGKVLSESEIKDDLEENVARLREQGYIPYVAPIGGSMVGGSMESPLGAIASVEAFAETMQQATDQGIQLTHILHASSSGGTQAGLAVGAKCLSRNVKVIGISVSYEKNSCQKDILALSLETQKALELDPDMTEQDIIVFDEYIKEGYGIVNREVADVLRMTAIKEGIFLDPVYTGKAMVALRDLIQKGYFAKDDKIVFVHTGGTPALFPNRRLIGEFLSNLNYS